MPTPSSLIDAFEEDPNRFLKYLDLKKIARSKDPYKEFKRQMQNEFAGTTNGLNMWHYLKSSYKLQNILWKGKDLQSKLPKEFQGAYKKKEYQKLLTMFVKAAKVPVKILGGAIKQAVKVGKEGVAYTRKGKVVKEHSKSKPRLWGKDEIDFLSRRVGESPKSVTMSFNKTFGTGRTYESIRTKMLRIKK